MSIEAEKSPWLEAATKGRLVKTQQAGKYKLCCSDLYSVDISDGAVITRSYESSCKVFNKSNLQPKTPSRVIPTRDNILFNDAISNSGSASTVSNDWMVVNNEFEKMWEGVVVPNLRYYSGTCLQEPTKTTKASVRIQGALAEIQTEHFPQTLPLEPF
jgi:hypothetical protein